MNKPKTVLRVLYVVGSIVAAVVFLLLPEELRKKYLGEAPSIALALVFGIAGFSALFKMKLSENGILIVGYVLLIFLIVLFFLLIGVPGVFKQIPFQYWAVAVLAAIGNIVGWENKAAP